MSRCLGAVLEGGSWLEELSFGVPKPKHSMVPQELGMRDPSRAPTYPGLGKDPFLAMEKKEKSCSRILLEEEIAGAETIIKPQI